jgi:hypothetical protein
VYNTLYSGKIGLERQGKFVQKFDAAFGTMVRIIKCFLFEKAGRNVILNFIFNKAKQN